jgi:hypothetical protein
MAPLSAVHHLGLCDDEPIPYPKLCANRLAATGVANGGQGD